METEVPTESEAPVPETTKIQEATVNPTTASTKEFSEPESEPTEQETAPTESTPEPTQPTQTETEAPETTSDPLGTKYACILDDKPVEEIVSLCMSIISTMPYAGQTYEAYQQSLPVQPISGSSMSFEYAVPAISTNYNMRDALIKSVVNGTHMEMDGTIGLDTTNFQTNAVSIYIRNYAKAAEIYARFKEVLTPYYMSLGYVEITEVKETLTWTLRGKLTQYKELNNYLDTIYIASMGKTDYGYGIWVQKIYR